MIAYVPFIEAACHVDAQFPIVKPPTVPRSGGEGGRPAVTLALALLLREEVATITLRLQDGIPIAFGPDAGIELRPGERVLLQVSEDGQLVRRGPRGVMNARVGGGRLGTEIVHVDMPDSFARA